MAQFGVEKQELEQGKEDAAHDDLTGATNNDTTLPDNVGTMRRNQLVADALRLERRLQGRASAFSRQDALKQTSRNKYWLLNYQLLRWMNDQIADVDKVLAIHKRRAGVFIGRRKFMPWLWKWKWMRMDAKGYVFGLSVLVGSLARSAKDALTVLQGVPDRRSQFFLRADSLFNLRCARWEEIQANSRLTAQFWNQVAILRDVSCWPAKPIRAWHLDVLLQNIPEEEQQRILSAYLDKYDHLDDTRLLHLVDCYTRLKDVDAALSVLRRVSPVVLQQRSGKAAPRCTNLLELESVQRNGGSHSFKVLPTILELGVPPDDIIYDLVTQNSVKFELPAVAWDIFRYAKNQGATIGPQTHLMLLKDSYLRKNADTLNEMLSIIQESPDLYQHPPINAYMVNIIRGICVYEKSAGPKETLARMLAVYDKAYSRISLAIAGVIRHDQVDQGNPELPRPEALSLAFMIFSYTMAQTDECLMTRFWERLIHKIQRGNPELSAAANYPVFYDGFICFYSKNERTISQALAVLRYMLADGTCLPGDITWSIVIGMFLRHGKHESAEKIRQLMLQRRVPVTEEAWRHVLLQYPYTEVAQEVKRILGLEPEAEVQNGRLLKDADDGPESEYSENIEDSIDVTAKQASPVDHYSSDVESGTSWTTPEGLDSILNLTKKGWA